MILFRALVRAALMIQHLGNNTLAVGKMWVAGKDDWGVGAQEGVQFGGTGDSHPGIKVPDLPPGVRPISHSPGGLRETGGGAPPGGVVNCILADSYTNKRNFEQVLSS